MDEQFRCAIFQGCRNSGTSFVSTWMVMTFDFKSVEQYAQDSSFLHLDRILKESQS